MCQVASLPGTYAAPCTARSMFDQLQPMDIYPYQARTRKCKSSTLSTYTLNVIVCPPSKLYYSAENHDSALCLKSNQWLTVQVCKQSVWRYGRCASWVTFNYSQLHCILQEPGKTSTVLCMTDCLLCTSNITPPKVVLGSHEPSAACYCLSKGY